MNLDHNFNNNISDIIHKLRRDEKVSEAPLIHSQSVIRAVIDTGADCTMSFQVKDKRDIILNFAIRKSFPLIDVIDKITSPVNCVRAAHITAKSTLACLTVTIPYSSSSERPDRPVPVPTTTTKDRDRDTIVAKKKYPFHNIINNVFEHVGWLCESDLVAAQTVQRYMINLHILQPLVNFSVTEKGIEPGTFIVHAENIDMIDLFFIRELVNECKSIKEIEFVIPDTTPTTIKPVFELRFTITKTANNNTTTTTSTTTKTDAPRRSWLPFF